MNDEEPEPFVSNYPRSDNRSTRDSWRYVDKFFAVAHLTWGFAIVADLVANHNFYGPQALGLAVVAAVAFLYWFAKIVTMIAALVLVIPCSCMASMACDAFANSNLLHATHNYIWIPGGYAAVRLVVLSVQKAKSSFDYSDSRKGE